MLTFTQTPDAPFAIGPSTTRVLAEPSPWAKRFAEERAIVCHDVIEPALLDRLLATADGTGFLDEDVPGLGTRQIERPPRVGGTLNLLLRRANLIDWLEEVTGEVGIVSVEGRLVQTRAGGDALDWHDDRNDAPRALGVTISLGDAGYEGGAFEMRRKNDPATTRTFKHARPGTALIFDVGRGVEHRVLPLSAGGPRRVFAGWFLRKDALPKRYA